MNFREGTRRLALWVGCLGAIAGAFGSYLELKPAIKQKAVHDRFERLATSDVVQKERRCRLLGYESGCSQMVLPSNVASVNPHQAKSEPDGWEVVNTPSTPAHPKGPWDKYASDTNDSKSEDDLADIAIPISSALNNGEIKTVNWSEGKDYLVESIETADGNTLHPIPLPSRWSYLLAVILPLTGFLLPWALIRSIQWVATGFLVNQESN